MPRALRPAGQKRPSGAFLGRGLANPFGRTKKHIAMYFCNALFYSDFRIILAAYHLRHRCTQNAVAENARAAQDQDDYNKRYNALVERYDRLKAQYDEVSTAISDNEARYEQMGRFITVLKDQEGVITEFDDALWSSLVEKIVVKSKEDVTVVFKDGTEMKAE